MKKGKSELSTKVFVLSILFFVVPGISLACDPKPHAKKYINQIDAIFGGEKPGLVVERGSDSEVAAYYDRDTAIIHIYKGDYEGSCEENLPYLRTVIAHEYAHHLTSKIKKVAWISGRENLADVGEHAISDAVWGSENVSFDDDLDAKYASQYGKLFRYIKNKMIK